MPTGGSPLDITRSAPTVFSAISFRASNTDASGVIVWIVRSAFDASTPPAVAISHLPGTLLQSTARRRAPPCLNSSSRARQRRAQVLVDPFDALALPPLGVQDDDDRNAGHIKGPEEGAGLVQHDRVRNLVLVPILGDILARRPQSRCNAHPTGPGIRRQAVDLP